MSIRLKRTPHRLRELAASGAYAVAEVFDWREGLEERPSQAPQFYLVIALATFIGLGIALSSVGAIRALFVAAVINGLTSPCSSPPSSWWPTTNG